MIGPKERAHYEGIRKDLQAQRVCGDFHQYAPAFVAFCTKPAGHTDRHFDIVSGRHWDNVQVAP